MELEFVTISNELSRTYVFPTGRYEVKSVAKLCVRPSGTHRLETTDGKKVIVPAGWLAIEICAPVWSA